MDKIIEKTSVITSMEVAEMVGKDHSNLMKDIRRYIQKSAEVKIDLGDFFAESTYLDANNQSRPCFNVTKKGCEFIANKLTGTKGVVFTAKYINRFHDMEDAIQNPLQGISKELQAVIVVDKRVTQVEQKVDTVKKELEDFKYDLPLLGVEMDKITNAVKAKGTKILGGKSSNAYKDNSLRTKVYRDIHSEIRRQFGVTTYKAIKRNQCETAVGLVEEYKPPIYLEELINAENAQETFA